MIFIFKSLAYKTRPRQWRGRKAYRFFFAFFAFFFLAAIIYFALARDYEIFLRRHSTIAVTDH